MYGSEPRDKFNSAGKKEPFFFLTSSVDCTRVLINLGSKELVSSNLSSKFLTFSDMFLPSFNLGHSRFTIIV